METDFDHIITEITAGKVLMPKTEAEQAHNAACDRANRIVGMYRDGIGLFQNKSDSNAIHADGEKPACVGKSTCGGCDPRCESY